MVWRFGKTKIRIEFSFCLMLCFALLIGNSRVLWVLLFASLHEMGHLAALFLFGGEATELTLAFYGIGLKHKASLSPLKESLFLLAGPAVNLFFALCGMEREINFSLFLINTLPVYPLDGGRTAAILLPERVCRGIGLLVILLIFAFAVYLRNLSLFLIGIYTIVFSLKEELL